MTMCLKAVLVTMLLSVTLDLTYMCLIEAMGLMLSLTPRVILIESNLRIMLSQTFRFGQLKGVLKIYC